MTPIANVRAVSRMMYDDAHETTAPPAPHLLHLFTNVPCCTVCERVAFS